MSIFPTPLWMTALGNITLNVLIFWKFKCISFKCFYKNIFSYLCWLLLVWLKMFWLRRLSPCHSRGFVGKMSLKSYISFYIGFLLPNTGSGSDSDSAAIEREYVLGRKTNSLEFSLLSWAVLGTPGQLLKLFCLAS